MSRKSLDILCSACDAHVPIKSDFVCFTIPSRTFLASLKMLAPSIPATLKLVWKESEVLDTKIYDFNTKSLLINLFGTTAEQSYCCIIICMHMK